MYRPPHNVVIPSRSQLEQYARSDEGERLAAELDAQRERERTVNALRQKFVHTGRVPFRLVKGGRE